MFVKCYAGAIVGIKAVKVDVEVNVAGGGLGLFLVGLPDNAVKESEQRIRAAFENSQRRMTAKKVVGVVDPAAALIMNRFAEAENQRISGFEGIQIQIFGRNGDVKGKNFPIGDRFVSG